jgi:hypothetical protein
MLAASGFTYITANNIYGSLLGQLLASGEIQFQAVSTLTQQPISFRVGGTDNGQMVSLPFCFPVINGVITADSSGITPQLPDVSLTNPVNIGYLVSIIDPLTGINILGSGYTIQPTGAAFDFDTYEPNLDDMVTMPLKLLAGTGITITQSGSTYTISLS